MRSRIHTGIQRRKSAERWRDTSTSHAAPDLPSLLPIPMLSTFHESTAINFAAGFGTEPSIHATAQPISAHEVRFAEFANGVKVNLWSSVALPKTRRTMAQFLQLPFRNTMQRRTTDRIGPVT